MAGLVTLFEESSFGLLRKTLFPSAQDIIEKYENNIINSSKVIERLLELAKEIRNVENAGNELGLTPEEMAFYDALSNGKNFCLPFYL